MKQTFVLLFSIVATLLLSSGNSYGQKKDIGTMSTNNLVSFTSINGTVYAEQNPKQDTVKVLMLVCDTSVAIERSVMPTPKGDVIFNQKFRCWLQFGYEVKSFTPKNQGWLLYEPIYLDENKKPLPKSIIVWMSKEIK